MKTIFTFFFTLAFLFSISKAIAQLSVTLVPSNFHGNNISCNGVSDGTLNAVPTGGTEPYTYEWSTSATSSSIEGLAAGSYTVTVTDAASSTVIQNITLVEPNALQLDMKAYQYAGGTNISAFGKSDGRIDANIYGGTTPYQYLWNDNSTLTYMKDIPAGTYSVTITDMNGCTIHDSKTLTQPALFQITSLTSPQHNGYEISCAGNGTAAGGGNDGAISLSVTGGVSPYNYSWMPASANQADPANLQNLPAGTYQVSIKDMNGVQITGQITLHAPDPLKPQLTPYFYPNNYNLSGYESGNGSITADVTGGVSGYQYLWSLGAIGGDIIGQGTNHITNCISASYFLQVTDANGCIANNMIPLSQPSKNAWSLNGDFNTNADTNYIGTNDSIDVVIKSNNIERARIAANGDFRISNLADTDTIPRIVYADAAGNLKRGTGRSIECIPPGYPTSWYTANLDDIYWTCGNVGIGTNAPSNKLDVNGNVRIRPLGSNGDALVQTDANGNLSSTSFNPSYLNFWQSQNGNDIYHNTGNVGIGTSSPIQALDIHGRMNILDGVIQKGGSPISSTSDLGLYSLTTGNWIRLVTDAAPIRFFTDASTNAIGSTAVMSIEANGKVAIGTTTVSSTALYKLYVEGGIATRDVKVQASGWPDYIFKTDYSLMSIAELEKFIIENHHLPDMPSADEVKNNEGFEVGDMETKLLKKVEELTLYIIAQQKQIDELKNEVKKSSK